VTCPTNFVGAPLRPRSELPPPVGYDEEGEPLYRYIDMIDPSAPLWTPHRGWIFARDYEEAMKELE